MDQAEGPGAPELYDIERELRQLLVQVRGRALILARGNGDPGLEAVILRRVAEGLAASADPVDKTTT